MPTVAKIISHSRVITLAATPESIAPSPGTPELSTEVVIQAKSTNAGDCFIGDNASQDFAISPGNHLPITDLFQTRVFATPGSNQVPVEIEFDLDKIFCKVGVNGEGVNVLRSELVTT